MALCAFCKVNYHTTTLFKIKLRWKMQQEAGKTNTKGSGGRRSRESNKVLVFPGRLPPPARAAGGYLKVAGSLLLLAQLPLTSCHSCGLGRGLGNLISATLCLWTLTDPMEQLQVGKGTGSLPLASPSSTPACLGVPLLRPVGALALKACFWF